MRHDKHLAPWNDRFGEPTAGTRPTLGRRGASLWSALVGFAVAACAGEGPTDPLIDVTFFLTVPVHETDVVGAFAEVAGPALAGTRSYELDLVGGFASGTVRIPVGTDWTVTVSTFDESQMLTHVGSVTLDVSGVLANTLTITLLAQAGGNAIIATLSGWRVSVDVLRDTVAVGDTITLTATIVDAAGDTLDANVDWVSDDSDVVTVVSTGVRSARVLATGTGEAIVTASYGGVVNGLVLTVRAARPGSLSLALVADGFQSPIYVTHAPGDSERLFVVERGGRIRIVRAGGVLAIPFLDISDRVLAGGERGLLGLTFHPRYAENGELFVYYTNMNGDSHVARFTVSADPDQADPSSENVLLVVPQPYSNHNGGLVTFGLDSMLYIGLGDGGSGGDPEGNGQDSTTLLGSILRIDVDTGNPYGIPADNPFVSDAAARPEIWAYGLRNPWRYSFDRLTGDLYIGDVGQSAWEEIDVQSASSGGGENYGWNVMEGAHCYNATTCDQSGLVLPVLEFSHSDGCSVTGGYVYRGTALDGFAGRYFYSDYCGGWIRSFRLDGGVAADPHDHTADLGTVPQVVSFGEDAAGELYIVSLTGSVYRLSP